MKQLLNLFSRMTSGASTGEAFRSGGEVAAGAAASKPASRRSRGRNARRTALRVTGRSLISEALEKRELLAGDLPAVQNSYHAGDVNGDWRVTPLDALIVINQLSRSARGVSVAEGEGVPKRFLDVNGDGNVTLLDALNVMNMIHRGEAQIDPVLELQLEPRISKETAFGTDQFNPATRELNVAVGEIFVLEVLYRDLRQPDQLLDGAGALALYADILTSTGGRLEPILTETQELTFASSLLQARGGEVRFAFADDPTNQVAIPYLRQPGTTGPQFNNNTNRRAAIGFAINELKGLNTSVLSANVDAGTLFEIRYLGNELAYVNIPDLLVTTSFTDIDGQPITVTTTLRSIETGTPQNPNSAAVPFNLDVTRRADNGSAPDTLFNEGSFDPATGFMNLGTQLVSIDGGNDEDLVTEPFDVFRIPVRVNQPLTAPLTLTVAPGSFETLMFGIDTPIPDDLILVDTADTPQAGDGFGFFRITTAEVVEPVSIQADNATLNFQEDGPAQMLDLATLTDVDPIGFPVNYVITTSTPVGRGTLVLNNSVITYTPAADDFTLPGSPLTFVYTATAGSLSDTGTVSINIASVNDPPIFVPDPPVNAITSVPLTIVGSTLTANDIPGPSNEGQTVTIAAVAPTSAQGGTVTLSGQNLIYTSAVGFTGNDTINYTITDGIDTAPATLTVIVSQEQVIVTVVAGDETLEFQEDGPAQTVDLRDLTNVTVSSGSVPLATFEIVTSAARGTTELLNGNTVRYTPAADDFTITPLSIVYRATAGGVNDTGTIFINIASVNDPPVFVPDAPVNATTAIPLTIVGSTLTQNDSPGPGNENQTVTIAAVTSPTSQGGTVTLSGQNLIYTSAAGFVGTDTINYTITDGLATAPATLSVNVMAPTPVVTVVAADATRNFQEDGPAQTIDLVGLTTVTGSTLTPVFAIVTPAARGTTELINGNSIRYTPAPDDFTTTPLTIVYRATVGAVSDTGTISINIASVNDPPVAEDDAVFANKNQTLTIAGSTLLANDRPGPPNESGQTLSIVSVAAIVGANATVGMVRLEGSNVIYTPPTDFVGVDRFEYTISDGELTDTAVVTVTVRDQIPSMVSGTVFTDFITNTSDPVRDGVQSSNEPSVGGLPVRLTNPGSPERTVLTDANGRYAFGDLAPGTYTVTVDFPDTIIPGVRVPGDFPTTGTSTSFTIVIPTGGGVEATGNNFTSWGTRGAASNRLDILFSQYQARLMAESGDPSLLGSVFTVMGSSGTQQYFEMGPGYEGIRFTEVAINATQDKALLTVLRDDGTVGTALLGRDEFLVNSTGRVVRIVGSANRFDFSETDRGVLESEFGNYRDAVDRILSEGAV